MLSDRCLSFFCLLRPWVFKNFLIFALDRHFQVFTPKSCFFFFFFSFSFFFNCSIMHIKIHSEQVNDLSRILAEKKRDNSLVDYKNLSRKTLFSPSIHVWSKWTFQVCNVGQGSWFERKDKQAQIVFQGDLNQGSFLERSFFIVFSFISHFFIIFPLILHFSFHYLRFALAHFYFSMG